MKNHYILVQISLKYVLYMCLYFVYVHKDSINNMSSLVQVMVMAWHQIDDKPLPDPKDEQVQWRICHPATMC